MITIYVGMALTNAPEEFRSDFQMKLKAALRKLEGVEVFDFVGIDQSRRHEVYPTDISLAEKADLGLFIVDFPSTGMGREIERRFMRGKPNLFFTKEGKTQSAMLEDGSGELFSYKTVDDIYATIEVWLQEHQMEIDGMRRSVFSQLLLPANDWQ